MSAGCRPPILLDRALAAPDAVLALLEATAPHFPVQRYFQSGAEMRAQSGPDQPIVAPNFRADWATEAERVDGVEPILENRGFRDAAAALFGSDRVRPWGVYSNVTWQLPFHQGAGHTDVPAFLGFDRRRYPTWLLSVMGQSGLFETERIEIATAVAWFYRGRDGGFAYWPDGPDAPPRVHEGAIYNTAIVGDNDRMFHRVRPVGPRQRGMLPGMTLQAQLDRCGGAWVVRQAGETRAEVPESELRISVSWKAYVYRDAAQERRHREGRGGLELGAVVDRFAADLRRRGATPVVTADPLHDEAWVAQLTRAYVREPAILDR